MEQSELNKERVFAKLIACPSLFERLGPIKQDHTSCRAGSKIDICLVEYQVSGNKVSQSCENSKRFADLLGNI